MKKQITAISTFLFLNSKTAKLVLVYLTSVFLDINVFPPSYALVTHIFSVTLAMLHRYTQSYSHQNQYTLWGTPSHKNEAPPN